jgi:hypothetical protein
MAHAERNWCPLGFGLVLSGVLAVAGCYNTPIDRSDYTHGPTPLRAPSPANDGACSYEDSLDGAKVFQMYCAGCHNARTLAERPFSNYQNVAQHMRVRANLTGKEYAKLMDWMRRWNDIPPPVQHEEQGPRRFFFSQPISELRDQQPKTRADLPSGPRPGFLDDVNSGQPPPGNGPREGR